jgi:hypothetical protein
VIDGDHLINSESERANDAQDRAHVFGGNVRRETATNMDGAPLAAIGA